MTFVLWGLAQGFQSYAPFLKLLNPNKESLCIKLLQQLSHLYVVVVVWQSEKAARKLIHWWFDSLYCEKESWQ